MGCFSMFVFKNVKFCVILQLFVFVKIHTQEILNVFFAEGNDRKTFDKIQSQDLA